MNNKQVKVLYSDYVQIHTVFYFAVKLLSYKPIPEHVLPPLGSFQQNGGTSKVQQSLKTRQEQAAQEQAAQEQAPPRTTVPTAKTNRDLERDQAQTCEPELRYR